MRKRQNVTFEAFAIPCRALLFETLTYIHTTFTHTLSLNHSYFRFAHSFSPSTHSLQNTVHVHKVLRLGSPRNVTSDSFVSQEMAENSMNVR